MYLGSDPVKPSVFLCSLLGLLTCCVWVPRATASVLFLSAAKRLEEGSDYWRGEEREGEICVAGYRSTGASALLVSFKYWVCI